MKKESLPKVLLESLLSKDSIKPDKVGQCFDILIAWGALNHKELSLQVGASGITLEKYIDDKLARFEL